MLKIGFNGRPFCQDQIRGLGRHTLELIKQLKHLHPEIEIYIYSYGEISTFFKQELSFAKFRDKKIKPKILWDLFFLSRQVKKDQLDLFHSTNNLGVPFFILNKIPIFTTIHDHFTHDARINFGSNPKSWWAAVNYRIELFLLKRSSHFFTVSEDAKNNISKKLGITPQDITVAYNGTNLLPSPLLNEQVIEKYFLYVGGLEERKNILIMLKAFVLFSQLNTEKFKLKIVGNPQLASAEVCELLNTNRDIFILLNAISDHDLSVLYQQAEALIFPSREEGFGLPLVEAMSLECPVIASDIAVFREIAQDAALYFPTTNIEQLKDKLMLVAGNLELRDKLIKLGKEQSRKFTWEKMAKNIFLTYTHFIDNLKGDKNA